MSDPTGPNLPPGWYPDGVGDTRWWDAGASPEEVVETSIEMTAPETTG
jgi:hypothetical protein